jgi:hypothetical protein
MSYFARRSMTSRRTGSAAKIFRTLGQYSEILRKHGMCSIVLEGGTRHSGRPGRLTVIGAALARSGVRRVLMRGGLAGGRVLPQAGWPGGRVLSRAVTERADATSAPRPYWPEPGHSGECDDRNWGSTGS